MADLTYEVSFEGVASPTLRAAFVDCDLVTVGRPPDHPMEVTTRGRSVGIVDAATADGGTR